RRGSAPGPRAYAAGAGALPLDPAPARRAPKGLAPLESLLRLRAGRGWTDLNCPAIQPARTAAGWIVFLPRFLFLFWKHFSDFPLYHITLKKQ
ncbi:hypothetical protein D3Z48_17275, partial [Clostridiaceae bacterium]|nr:hypothetical protein [Clostridiaceae bacterium]